jgi:hypothetical protein
MWWCRKCGIGTRATSRTACSSHSVPRARPLLLGPRCTAHKPPRTTIGGNLSCNHHCCGPNQRARPPTAFARIAPSLFSTMLDAHPFRLTHSPHLRLALPLPPLLPLHHLHTMPTTHHALPHTHTHTHIHIHTHTHTQTHARTGAGVTWTPFTWGFIWFCSRRRGGSQGRS